MGARTCAWMGLIPKLTTLIWSLLKNMWGTNQWNFRTSTVWPITLAVEKSLTETPNSSLKISYGPSKLLNQANQLSKRIKAEEKTTSISFSLLWTSLKFLAVLQVLPSKKILNLLWTLSTSSRTTPISFTTLTTSQWYTTKSNRQTASWILPHLT